MFLDEDAIRRALAERRPPLRDPWPEIRGRLEERSPRYRVVFSAAAAALAFLAAAETFRRSVASPPRLTGVEATERGFRVTNVSRDGRPASALVIQPDANTIVVIPQ